jgi:effector-binding domain-containing protein
MTVQIAGPETISIVERKRQTAVVLDVDGPVTGMARLVGDALARAAEDAGRHEIPVAGPPFARYLSFGPSIRAEIGFPVAAEYAPTPPLRLTQLPGGRAVSTTHVGPYETIGEAWQRATEWLREHDLDQIGPPWESYLSGPDDPTPHVTEIFWPIR